MKRRLTKKQGITWPDKTHFFLTSSCWLHYHYFREDREKMLVRNKIAEIKKSTGVKIESFSIQINHVHLQFFADRGQDVTKVKTILHSGISREFNRKYELKRKFKWSSTRSYWIKDDKMYWGVMGYVIGNLLKHREVSTFQELYENNFSSFSYIADKYGFDYACELVRDVIDKDEDEFLKPLPWAG